LHAQKKKKGNQQKGSSADDEEEEYAFGESKPRGVALTGILRKAVKTNPELAEEDNFEDGDADEDVEVDEDVGEDGDDDEEEDEDVGTVDSIDEIDAEEEEQDVDDEGTAVAAIANEQWKVDVTKIITDCIATRPDVKVHRISWAGSRIEVIVVEQRERSAGEEEDLIGPGVEILKDTHRDLYNRLEARDADLNVVSRYEICVASPGIGQFLRTERDFLSFRGFPIAVRVKQEYKKKMLFEGTLVERDENNVLVSLKGRIVKIPRELIETVSLPKSKFESTDTEMRKLR